MGRIALIVACFFILSATTAEADSIAVGVVSDGYTYAGSGVWAWSDGSQWTRQWVSPCYVGGCYQAGYFNYYPYHAPATVKIEKVDQFGILAKAVAARAKVDDQVRLNAQFIKAAQDLGFVNPGYGVYGNALFGTFGYNSSTIYGYGAVGLSQLSDPFSLNIDQALLSLNQTTQSVNDAAREANAGLRGTVDNAVNQSAKLSAYSTRLAAAERLLKALDGPPIRTSTTGQFKFGNGEVLPEPKQVGASIKELWAASAAKNCVSCHSSEKKQGGYDVLDFARGVNTDEALRRLSLPADDKDHMPKEHPSLSADEQLIWFKEALEAKRPALQKK